MCSGNLPIWMRSRTTPEKEESSHPPSKMIVLVALLLTFISLSVFAGLRHAQGFHLPVISASITAFALSVYSKMRCSRKNVIAFIVTAIIVNLGMVFIAYRIGDRLSGTIASAGVVLFTGLIAVLLFARMDSRPSLHTKAAVLGTALAFTVAGPITYASGIDEGLFGTVSSWLLVVSVPMVFVAYMTFLTVLAYHKSEVTLPSDKWT